MKNIIVCNLKHQKHLEHYKKYVHGQIDNSLLLGWEKEDIIFAANFSYSYRGVESVVFDFDCDFCLTGSKVFAMVKLFDAGLINENAWLHDLDLWQTHKFEFPEDIADVGMTRYIGRWQGGSVFLRPTSKTIFYRITERIRQEKSRKEEPIIKLVLKEDGYKQRVTQIDGSYNVGATGFEKRYNNSQKPIKAIHMHPHRGTDYKRNIAGMNRLGVKTVDNDLLNIFSKYFNISKDLTKSASIDIKVNNSDYNIRDLCNGERFHTNRKFSFVDIADVLKGRRFLALPHKRRVSIDITVVKPGIFEIGLCNEHEDVISSFEKEYYEMEHIPLKTNYRDAKKIRLFRKFFKRGEKLHFKHKWRVNPIIIANKMNCRKR
jgi:hypothetical protein